jgi:hypothetical protein
MTQATRGGECNLVNQTGAISSPCSAALRLGCSGRGRNKLTC